MFQAWQSPDAAGRSFSLPTWENSHLYPGGRGDPEILKLEGSMTRERFMERHAGEPSPPAGRVVAGFSARQNGPDGQAVGGRPGTGAAGGAAAAGASPVQGVHRGVWRRAASCAGHGGMAPQGGQEREHDWAAHGGEQPCLQGPDLLSRGSVRLRRAPAGPAEAGGIHLWLTKSGSSAYTTA